MQGLNAADQAKIRDLEAQFGHADDRINEEDEGASDRLGSELLEAQSSNTESNQMLIGGADDDSEFVKDQIKSLDK
tara:strand:+ start:133 stop:360 length:228 start_codon:yes stop_codon:yes gene_type:complete